MSIEVHCEGCGKRYVADDHMAGKRMRCRVCSTIFTIPDNAGGGVVNEGLDGLAALEPQNFGHDSTILGHDQQVNLPASDQDGPMSMPSGRSYRPRMSYPYAAVVDRWLPILLLVLGPLWITLTGFASDDHATTGLTIARLLILMLTYLVLIFPMGLSGVNMAARDIGFMLPRTSTWRALATFMPTFAVGSVLWMVSGGHLWGLIIGVVSGLVLSCGTLWLLFHLRPSEIPAAAGYAAGMTALAVAIAGGVLFGLNALLSNAMVGMHKADTLTGSPFGTGFYWPKTDTPLAVKPKPRDTNSKPITIAPPPPTTPPPTVSQNPPPSNPENKTSPGTTPETTASAPANTSVASATPQNGEGSTIFTGAVDHGNETSNGTTQLSMTAPATAPVATLPPDQILKSPLVESVDLAPLEGQFDQLLRPMTPSPWAVAIRHGSDHGELDRLWVAPGNPPDGVKPWTAAGTAPYVAETKAVEKYALSPDGDLLAHVSTFPSFSVLVYSFKERRIIQTLKLQENSGEADVIGFCTAERLLVHRVKDGHDSMELWDAKANNKFKTFDLPKQTSDCAAALSPDGSILAMTGKDLARPGGGEPMVAIFLYDLPSASVRRLAVTDLGATADPKATGIAFSTDGSKVAALYEQGANGLLVVFRAAGLGKQILSQPLLPMPVKPEGPFSGSSLMWLSDDALVLYGKGVLSSTSGVQIGDLGMVSVTSQTFFKPDLCQLDIQSPHGIALVKLKMDEITKLQAAK